MHPSNIPSEKIAKNDERKLICILPVMLCVYSKFGQLTQFNLLFVKLFYTISDT